MAELEERIRTFLREIRQDNHEADAGGDGVPLCGGGDTFSERAEWFFKKRPELLNLLQELYNSYISVKETKRQWRHSSSFISSLYYQQQQEEEIDTNWDIESSLSNQTPDFDTEAADFKSKTLYGTGPWIINSSSFSSSRTGFDEFVSDLVINTVEGEILRGQMEEMEKQFQECWRKMEILKKLIEVLESERAILVRENSRLGYKVGEFMEENKRLEGEVMILEGGIGQLSRCLMKMREDERVCMLTRKIEELQTQINELTMEKSNINYDDNKEEEEEKLERGLRNGMGCFCRSERLMKIKRRINEGGEGRKWREKVKKGINNFPMFCIHGLISSSSSSSSSS